MFLALIAATYFIGRGFAQIPKVPIAGWKTPDFTVLLSALALLAGSLYARDAKAALALCVLIGSYNIGRGLANYYRSKVSMVLNR